MLNQTDEAKKKKFAKTANSDGSENEERFMQPGQWAWKTNGM